MKLIFIYGLPATGKLTVAKRLSAMTGYKLFHNHLAVDLLLSVFDFGSPAFVELREQIWLSVFDQASCDQLPGLIFTFAPEATVRATFPERAVNAITRNNGEVIFVELVCPLSELKHRIDSPQRSQYGKLTSVALFEQLSDDGVFDAMQMPKPQLSIDTSVCSPYQAAVQIANMLALDTLV